MNDEGRFEALFDGHYGDVLAYAVRRCGSRQDAEDVVAETFALAWRRLHEVPDGDQARLWLFGTARLVRHNVERSRRRQWRLAGRIRDRMPPRLGRGADAEVLARERFRRAFATLSEADQELLQLLAWEELSTEELAIVLEISTTAVWKRLQRARSRLRTALHGHDESESDAPGSAAAPGRRAAP